MKILLLSRYGRVGASSRVRSYQYLPYLRQHGIQITVSPLLGDDYLSAWYAGDANHLNARILPYLQRLLRLLTSYCFDVLWIEYELFPWLPACGEMLLKWLNIPYIVDYDDATFHRYDAHSSQIVRFFFGKKIKRVMHDATIVIVGNDYLAQYAQAAGATRVEYVPTVIDLEQYHTMSSSSDKGLTIGWIGTPITVKYLELVRPILSRIFQSSHARLVSVGAELPGFDQAHVIFRTWTENSEVSEIQQFDVGIMPLTDELWNKGKCGYKLIQYMACGKPVIASPIGVNTKIVEHGVNGFLADSSDEWFHALRFLRDHPELRKKMGEAGRKKVEKEYSLQVTQSRLLSILQSVRKGHQ